MGNHVKVMPAFPKNFASLRRAPLRHGARRACVFGSCALLLATTGCGWLGFGSDNPPASATAEPHADAAIAPDAFAAARAAIAREPAQPYWPFRLGELYAAADSTAAAATSLERSLAIDPDYAPALSLLTRIHYETGEHVRAIALLDAYLARNPDAPAELRAGLALHLDAAGDRGRAETELDRGAGDTRALRATRAYLSLRGDDLGGVLEIAQRALDADSDSAVNHNNYGVALLCAGRPVEARDAFRRALERDAALPGALYNMAIVETFYLLNESAGREWFARYKRHSSDDPDNLASALEADVSKLTAPGSR